MIGQTWSAGDFNYDGKVNALDFNALASGFGANLSGAAPLLFDSAPLPQGSAPPLRFSHQSIQSEDRAALI